MTAGILPDSRFTWRFLAHGGDSWGGTLIADTGLYDAGDTLPGAFGTYTILTVEDQGIDLSGLGLEDGQVFVDWYWDAQTAQFLATRNGAGTPAGAAGLGSEQDFAWTGLAWMAFGMAGAQQADAAVVAADSRFTFVFEAVSGDRWGGVLYDLAVSFDVGSIVTTAHGRYRITGEDSLGGAEAVAAGTVRLTGSYHDQRSNAALVIRTGDGVTTHGSAGLGSEVAEAWNGSDWQAFGSAGSRQADADGSSAYGWVFEADSGDRWFGGLWDYRVRYDVGSVVATSHGRYVITAETFQQTNPAVADGTVWVTGYVDALSGRELQTWFWGRLGTSSGTGGLGNEVDVAWTGTQWARFGQGGAWQADAKDYSAYGWVFEANSGDRWFGGLWDDRARYDVGSVVATPHGRYVITAETFQQANPAVADGTVWVTGYVDALSGRELQTWFWGRLGTSSGTGGLGNEVDVAWTGTQWARFGQGGAWQADAKAYSAYGWVFEADSGDRWFGGLWDDRARYDVGSVVATPHGRYVITAETFQQANPAVADGTVWVTGYVDALSGRELQTWFWGRLGTSSGTGGLGNEVDVAWTGTQWARFGQGGAYQVDVGSGAADIWPA